MGKTRTKHASPPICELRVELLDSEPSAWRVLRLSSGILLPRLNRVLLIALGWFKAVSGGSRPRRCPMERLTKGRTVRTPRRCDCDTSSPTPAPKCCTSPRARPHSPEASPHARPTPHAESRAARPSVSERSRKSPHRTCSGARVRRACYERGVGAPALAMTPRVRSQFTPHADSLALSFAD